MTNRRFFLDEGCGESRAVVTLGGRPERLIIARLGDAPTQSLGARVAARIRSVERAQGLAFVDLGADRDAILNLSPEVGPIVEGGWAEVEVRSEGRNGKGPALRWLGAAIGPVRLLASGPSVRNRLDALARGAEIETGAPARAAADRAQEEALETVFALPVGGSIAVELTRALTAVDVDIGARRGQTSKITTRAANLAALGEAARVLRLKGLGGLVVIDLVGRGHDGPALLAAARIAFAPDNPGVAIGSISRFGTLELTVPRRARPVVDILSDQSGAPTAMTIAMDLIRTLEQEAANDGGARLEALASAQVAEAAKGALAMLIERFGARLTVRGAPGMTNFEIVRP